MLAMHVTVGRANSSVSRSFVGHRLTSTSPVQSDVGVKWVGASGSVVLSKSLTVGVVLQGGMILNLKRLG